MRLDDFLVLGRTVPEESQRYGVRVCMAGYSPELGRLLRVYPLPLDNPLRVRHQAILEIQRNPQDSRRESFKLKDAVHAIYGVSEKPVYSVEAVSALAEQVAFPSIAAMNAQRVSLGFVRVQGLPRLVWKARLACAQGLQQELFDELVHDLRVNRFTLPTDYPQVPYVQFRDRDGWHCLQLREWGCYEYLRKHAFQPDGLAEALHLRETPTLTWYALVGNMAHRRNVWLVIHLFRLMSGHILQSDE